MVGHNGQEWKWLDDTRQATGYRNEHTVDVNVESNLTDCSGLGNIAKNVQASVKELIISNHKIVSLSCLKDFSGIENLIIISNPELKSLEGLENKANLLYVAAQNPVIKNEGKNRTDVGFISLDGLSGCSKLKYLVVFNNTALTDISGLNGCENLVQLYAYNCNIGSDDGLQGSGNGLDKLETLNLENNLNLGSVGNIVKCDKIMDLYLAGCTNMNYEQVIALEKVILQCGSRYSIPEYYSLGFSNVTSQDIQGGASFTDDNLDEFNGKTNLTRLRLQGCSNLSDEKLNEVLSTLTNMKYLSLNGCSQLVNLNFVDNMKLVELDLRGTKVTDLSKLNDDSSSDLQAFILASNNINNYQVLLKNVFENAGKFQLNIKDLDERKKNDQIGMCDFDPDSWEASYYNYFGLELTNVLNEDIVLPENLEYFSIGNLGASNTYDLSNCRSIEYVLIGGGGGTYRLPSSVDAFGVNFGIKNDLLIDFSFCNKIKYIHIRQGNMSFIEKWFETLPKEWDEEGGLENIYLTRVTLTNLSFLSKFNTSKLTTLRVGGWTSTEAVCTSLLSSSGIENASNLKSLTIEYSNISEIVGFDNLNNLSYLRISNGKVTNASNIGTLKSLTTLDLGYNQIHNVDFLTNNSSLKNITLSSNSFTKIPNLSELGELSTLGLIGCLGISDLSPLENLIKNGKTSLRTLNLTNCSGIQKENIMGYSNSELIKKLKDARLYINNYYWNRFVNYIYEKN